MKYFFGFLASIALIVLVFVLILRGFGGKGDDSKPKEVVQLASYATTDTEVVYSVDGPINADQNHNGYRITVGRTQTRIDILNGYEDKVVDSKTYPNNEESYKAFLLAINGQGFTRGDEKATKVTDERGICPTGNRYSFEIVNNGSRSQRYWSASCTKGTFKGNSSTLQGLFRKQVPDSGVMTAKIGF